MLESTHPFTNNLHCRVSFTGVARDSVTLCQSQPKVLPKSTYRRRQNGHAHLVALDLGLTLVNDFVDLSCHIAASPFPSAAMGFSPHEIQKRGNARNVLSFFQRFDHD